MLTILREAVVADAVAIAKVHVDSWRTTYPGIVPADQLARLSYSVREDTWRARLSEAGQGHMIFVAETRANGVIGFASGGPELSENPNYQGELYAIYILEEYQSLGVGRRLVSRVAETFLRLGTESMLVWVLADNLARGFYERLGGSLVAEKTDNIGGAELKEVAYGWRDIRTLASTEV